MLPTTLAMPSTKLATFPLTNPCLPIMIQPLFVQCSLPAFTFFLTNCLRRTGLADYLDIAKR